MCYVVSRECKMIEIRKEDVKKRKKKHNKNQEINLLAGYYYSHHRQPHCKVHPLSSVALLTVLYADRISYSCYRQRICTRNHVIEFRHHRKPCTTQHIISNKARNSKRKKNAQKKLDTLERYKNRKKIRKLSK